MGLSFAEAGNILFEHNWMYIYLIRLTELMEVFTKYVCAYMHVCICKHTYICHTTIGSICVRLSSEI